MSFYIYRPDYPLADYIQRLWYIEDQIPYRREKILPTGTIELIINFSDPHEQYHLETERLSQVHQAAWLVGFHTQAIINQPLGYSHMIGVSFKPSGAAAFFPFPFHEISNNIISLESIWGNFATLLHEQLANIPSVPEKFICLEAHLLTKLRPMNPLIPFAIERIQSDKGLLSIQNLCAQIGISPKHLAHLFKQNIGISPKAFARIIKLQRVLYSIDPNQAINWAMIAHHCGYYDQSHFNKDFWAFSGLTPSAYLANRLAVFQNLQLGDSVHFVPIG